MLEHIGDFGIRMKSLSFSVLCALLIVSTSCQNRVDEPKDRRVYVIGRTSGLPMPSIEMNLNGQMHSFTNSNGFVEVPGLTESDTLEPVESGFEYTLVNELETDELLNLTYLATKQATEKDSLAIALLKDLQNPIGLLPSIPYGSLVSTYDQALAAIAFTLAGEYQRAAQIFDYFESRRVAELENGVGGFYQFRDPLGVPSGRRWMGDNAWLLIALKHYPYQDNYTALITSLELWLVALEDAVEGGLWGGFDEQGDTIHKITEGNIDAFVALDGYTNFHRGILNHLVTEKWDSTDGNFIAWPTNPTYRFALDCNTWGFCSFPNFDDNARNSISRYALTVNSTSTSEEINGYSFDEDQDALWFEGTGQVAVMHWVAGDRVRALQVMSELSKGWIDGPVGEGLPYTANQGTAYGNDPLWSTANTEPCISSTAWYLMASFRHNPLFLGRQKTIPASEQFWAQ